MKYVINLEIVGEHDRMNLLGRYLHGFGHHLCIKMESAKSKSTILISPDTWCSTQSIGLHAGLEFRCLVLHFVCVTPWSILSVIYIDNNPLATHKEKPMGGPSTDYEQNEAFHWVNNREIRSEQNTH